MSDIDRKRSRLSQVLDQTAGFIGLLSVDGILLDVNKAPLAASGLRYEDVVGKPFWETGWWNRSSAVQAALKAAIESAAQGCPVHDEAIYFTADGSERFVDRSLVPVRDDAGNVTHVVAEGRDITDRKALERALRASEERFRLLFHSSPAALIINRLRDLLVLDVNEAFLALHGMTRRQVEGRTADELGWWGSATDRADFLRLMNEAHSVRDLTVRTRVGVADPSQQRLLIVSFECIEIEGEPCVLGTQVDVTERQRLLVFEERQRISADLHDSTVQTLYATVLRLTEAERLLNDSGSAVDRMDALQAELRETKRSLLETIRSMRAIVDGLASTQLAERGLRHGLSSIADDLETSIGARVRVVVADEADTLLQPEAAGELLLLTREAASNVARHSGATIVTFMVSAGPRWIELSIKDNGRGFALPPAAPIDAASGCSAIPRFDESSHRGLCTMAQRARALRARFDIKSAPGQGTAVHVRVPRPT